MFFEPDVVEELLLTHAPYSDRGKPEVTNVEDDVYGADGWKLLVPIISDDAAGGYVGEIMVGLPGLPS